MENEAGKGMTQGSKVVAESDVRCFRALCGQRQ